MLQVSFDVACECVRGAFDLICKMIQNDGLRPVLDKFVPCVAALPAAVLACVMSHPGDMVLTSYYKDSDSSVVATARALIKAGGLRALFRGLRARLVHVISIIWVQVCLSFTVLELGTYAMPLPVSVKAPISISRLGRSSLFTIRRSKSWGCPLLDIEGLIIAVV